jgi:hypothetical protein
MINFFVIDFPTGVGFFAARCLDDVIRPPQLLVEVEDKSE